jgi:hypothetical protein
MVTQDLFLVVGVSMMVQLDCCLDEILVEEVEGNSVVGLVIAALD